MHSRLVSEGSVQYCPHPQSDSVLPIWVCNSPHTGSPLSMTWWWGRTCWPSILRKGRCGRWTVKSCQFMSQPLLLCEACYPGGRGFNSCDQGQLGVHRQHEAGGAGGGEGEEETEGEEERRYYGED